MKKTFKAIISIVLTVAMLITSTVTAFAASSDEEYLCELRIVYAEDYMEARDILDDSDFYDYELLEENLNEGTGNMGVFLAYKTTTDVEDAITDISAIQMGGGYRDGNYQEMIKQSYDEYTAMGKTYLKAIKYWRKAYDAGDFLATSAYRQLNFYSVLDKEAGYDGDLLGDIFYKNVDEFELATMFMEGNSYALKNIRSLIAMGVSYNSDGLTYLKKVAAEAAKMDADASVYDDKNYKELAQLIVPTIIVFKDMLKELSVHKDELNYEDDVFTEKELKYAEYMAISQMLEDTKYLGGKTLHDFCLDYTINEEDYSSLYPLVAALNEGQEAMVRVAHYYDVVRYSTTNLSKETIETELNEMAEKYGETPFDIYTGVDRSIYDGTFALTAAAYRAETVSDKSLADFLFDDQAVFTSLALTSGVVGTGSTIYAIVKTIATKKANAAAAAAEQLALAQAKAAKAAAAALKAKTINGLASQNFTTGSSALGLKMQNGTWMYFRTHEQFIDLMFAKYNIPLNKLPANPTFAQKYDFFMNNLPTKNGKVFLDKGDATGLTKVKRHIDDALNQSGVQSGQQAATTATQASAAKTAGVGGFWLLSGIAFVAMAAMLGYSIYSYYNPDYDDIPLEMVDYIETVDGDRYIKYNVVLEAEARDGGDYVAGDTNAFEGQRWNALYYTKSYEAGKPLLAEFDLSNKSNAPLEGYAPVRRFGEVVCYDLNKHNFDYDCDNIYLSVKQSENQKAAVAEVPEVVGSIFGTGWALIAGAIGLLAGVGCTIGTQTILKKKKHGGADPKPEV